MTLTVWKLRNGADKRIRQGHPWVFSNELEVSPKGHPQGAPVELQDSRGQFLARGYGNPHSLISFRALTFDPTEKNPMSYETLANKLVSSWILRKKMGFKGSFRLCFGEVDEIPGLVIDYYLSNEIQVFAVQILTAGMSHALNDICGFFKIFHEQLEHAGQILKSWENTAVVLRNDVNIRKLEGLEVEASKVIKSVEGIALENIEIILNSASDSNLIKMNCNLFDGQKTGFFLDQTHNIFLVNQLIKEWKPNKQGQIIRVLDLCCYVGHWSTQLSYHLKNLGFQVEVTQVDVSKEALAFAKINAVKVGATVVSKELDVVHQLDQLASDYYDIVIADPPAFIKNKKDIPNGKHAYMKMNHQAFRVSKKGSLVVSCSCSGLLTEEDFRESIQKGLGRSKVQVKGVLRGGHAADHPTKIQFPEGFYLKMYVHYTY